MNNYIILNGVNSNTITGLIISSLPPITKPLMRTNIETIDGRDGDIVTKLGYSAYDKTIKIGLYGDFDIDDVITFFNSDGQVIFSNEQDKYYNYQILNQIDYERLLRFKTADITLHCQPFKYSSVEGVKPFTITNETSINIRNNGNYISKPIITITGTGTINLSLNNHQIFIIDLSENTQITIDTNLMDAYNPNTQTLMNRVVTGDYDKFALNVGTNTISWAGTISQIDIKNFSRWL